MRNHSRITPEGTKDILFEECKVQREVEKRLGKVFQQRKYYEVLTPGLEYFDVFNLPGAGIPQEEMYKTTDNNGNLIVFRPDSTLPIARMVASRLQNARRPVRLFYNQNIYRNRPDLSGRNNEVPQMGVELLGAGGLRADLEVMATAVEALNACGVDYRMEIGHALLFQSFAMRLPLSEEEIEEIRLTIESKNYARLSELLDGLQETEAVTAIKMLPRLFGGEEALTKAETFCTDDETRGMLSYLKELYHALLSFGLGDRLMVDLGLVQRNDYYTGVVFSAYTEAYGDAVLMGGRYDNLLEKFSLPMPAVGFSVDTAALVSIKQTAPADKRKERILVHSNDGYEVQGQKKITEMARAGICCENALFAALDETRAYAKANHFTKIIVVGETVTEIPLQGEGTI